MERILTYTEFEVIEFVDDRNPYPTLFVIDWDIENENVIDFKNKILSLEYKDAGSLSN